MTKEYTNNHYVPEWYQKKFIPEEQKAKNLYYLDFKPGVIVDPRGITHPKRPVNWWGPSKCFKQRDLYTVQFASQNSTEIEQLFFGTIDRKGQKAVEYFSNFTHPSANGDALHDILMFMSTQKLRTPKGLSILSEKIRASDHNQLLREMIHLRLIHCAIWSECVWLIADASRSETKFIISDHPVTVYNRKCGPRSQWCRGYNDPDIWFQGTHTIFPLSLEKILILTNLSWIRNPYQDPVSLRPNSNPLRSAMFNFTDIQTLRYLNEQEVMEINFIIKSRALRYIAAAKEEWLYPDRYVSKSEWPSYGDGYLFMPDPRSICLGGELIMGYKNGTMTSFDEYGRRPWEKDYNKESRTLEEAVTLDRFKGEFARLYGQNRRGRVFQVASIEEERDPDEFHQYHLSLEQKYRKKKKK